MDRGGCEARHERRTAQPQHATISSESPTISPASSHRFQPRAVDVICTHSSPATISCAIAFDLERNQQGSLESLEPSHAQYADVTTCWNTTFLPCSLWPCCDFDCTAEAGGIGGDPRRCYRCCGSVKKACSHVDALQLADRCRSPDFHVHPPGQGPSSVGW